MRRLENAKISGTRFGFEDHGILTFHVYLEGQGWGQGCGGYALDEYNKETNERDIGYGTGIIAMKKIMETVGVEKWEDLPGTLVRCKIGGLGTSEPPIIGHIIKDQWFDLADFMSKQKVT